MMMTSGGLVVTAVILLLMGASLAESLQGPFTNRDPLLNSSEYTETVKKFTQTEFNDTETNLTLRYNLFVPENYSSSDNASFPLLIFIHDDSVTGKSTIDGLTQGAGGVVWAMPDDQAKHPCFVLAPVFETSTVSGGVGQFGNAVVESNVQTFLDLVKYLKNEYRISRVYGTGQSMGGMTTFYLNSHYAGFYTASLYVSSQWNSTQLSPLENQTFFYIVSAGDSRASEGQTDLLALFNETETSYTHTQMNASASEATKNDIVEGVLAQNKSRNFITWDATLSDGTPLGHNLSFDYGYLIKAVRDWLFQRL